MLFLENQQDNKLQIVEQKEVLQEELKRKKVLKVLLEL